MAKHKPYSAHLAFSAGVGLALLAGVVAVPFTSTALLRSIDDEGKKVEQVEDQTQRAIKDFEPRRQRERKYWDAMDVYYNLLDRNIVTKHTLDINKPETFMKYLDPKYIESLKQNKLHESADQGEGEEQKAVVQEKDVIDDLELPALESERDLVEGYADLMGFCPLSLKNHYASRFRDLYDLCVRLQRRRTAVGIVDLRRAAPAARGDDYQSLKKRLDLFSESLQGARKRAVQDGKDKTTR